MRSITRKNSPQLTHETKFSLANRIVLIRKRITNYSAHQIPLKCQHQQKLAMLMFNTKPMKWFRFNESTITPA